MSDEHDSLPLEQPQAAAALPDVENLADSEDADLIEARAKLLEAHAKLTKASVPLLDKIVLRGLLPIALAIVGPWALWQFNTAREEQEKQGQVIVELQDLLEAEKEETASRQARSSEWRDRMKALEEEKAAELTAMATMVCRLDDMLKSAVIQQAVLRLMDKTEARGPAGVAPRTSNRARVVRAVTQQIQLPGLDPGDVEKLAGQQYDRIQEQQQDQR